MKKNYGLLTMMILLLSLAIFAVKGDIFRKPQQIMPEDLDLAGGPEKEVRGFPKREMVDLITMYPELFIASGDSEEKKVALTFDDGPDDIFTPQILDVLKEKNVKATFFVIGKRAEGYPKVMRRIVDESHLVGNHTWSHPNIMKISLEDAKQEVLKTEKLLKSYCDESADRIKIFRSPYGSIDPDVNIYAVGDQMDAKGWQINRLQNPDGLHAMITAQHLEVMDAYLCDLRESVATVKAHPELAQTGSAATYGMMAHIPLRGMVKNRVLEMFAGMYKAGGAQMDLHAASGSGGAGGAHPGTLDALVERLAALYVTWKQRRQA